jgi:hypothetical protein
LPSQWSRLWSFRIGCPEDGSSSIFQTIGTYRFISQHIAC